MKLINDESILPLIESQPQKKNDHSKQKVSKIQGLRGVAILAVLLFHIRQDLFAVGYLGVDVFFVISGYLMCMLLSRHKQLNVSNVIDFYYRRIKRIVPIYLFVIFSVLSSAILIWCYPTDYESMYQETIKPLFFASNIPESAENNYFTQSVDGYKFFKHLWSLSVEIQFYCFVPLLVYLLNYFSSLKKVFIVITIACLSFWLQLNSTGNEEHMSLNGRIWQFMCGFLAHYLSEYFNKSKGSSNTKNCGIKIGGYLLDIISTIGILTLISIQVFESKAITRLILLLFVIITIARPGSNLILSNTLLVHLGDVSYSVYMIHWPVFEWHRYWDISSYMYFQKIGFLVAFLLISSSTLIGYYTETIYIKLSGKIQGWKSLLTIIAMLYLSIYGSLYYMKSYNETKSVGKVSMKGVDKNAINQEMIKLWNNQDDIKSWTIEKSLKYNQYFKELSKELWTCNDKRASSIPTAYDARKMKLPSTCQMEGNGTKSIVLIGNSHARSMYYGIEQQFHGIYKHLTMISVYPCMVIDPREDDPKMCKVFRDDMLKMLRMWNYPIDIIIFGHAYPLEIIPPFNNTNIATDKTYQDAQTLFSGMSQIARDVVFVSMGRLDSAMKAYMETLQRRILYNQDLTMFRVPLSFQQKMAENMNKRLRAIECSKCILVDWSKLWCDENTGYCDTIDFKIKLAYFKDLHHHNAYGSMKAGNFIRTLYDDWTLNHTSISTSSTSSSASTPSTISLNTSTTSMNSVAVDQ